MIRQNALHHAEKCRFCWMCRHLCPVQHQTGKELNTPRAKGLLLSMVNKKAQTFDKDMAEAMYECLLCDACTNDCATGYQPPLFIREARTEAVVSEVAPASVMKLIENVETTGNIYGEKIKTAAATISGDFDRLMSWADKFRRLQVRTNADTPHDAQQAAAFGAEGIGLCRTEHMFFEADRIKAMREMIVSETSEQRERALAKLEPIQQADFEAIYEAMKGRPVTIRLLDPPLHEFVPTDPKDIADLAAEMGLSVEHLNQVISSLHEFNPMMGHRGCRLDVTFPEIAKMQTAAIIKAALAVQGRHPDWQVVPEIMIPLVGEVKEYKFVENIVVKTADELIAASGVALKYEVGTMIEIPRAALTADEIAKEADFFCFGTNDLTQMTFGFSRDDAGKFLPAYYANKIYESDPFARLDTIGVGKLMEMAVKLGKAANPKLHCGICGEHGGDPSSIEFCNEIGLNYVSCSPYRVPIARLSAAQAAIKAKK